MFVGNRCSAGFILKIGLPRKHFPKGTKMADAKGKYAVDIEDGQEAEDGIPQWAVFAGIGGLLLVIIIIIIVVVAGGSTVPHEGEFACLGGGCVSKEVEAEVVAALAAISGVVNVGGADITFVDVKAVVNAGAVTAAFTDDNAPVKRVTPFTSVVTAEVSIPADMTEQQFKDKAAETIKKQYSTLMGIPEDLITVTVELVAARRELTEESAAARRLAGKKTQKTAVNAFIPELANTGTIDDAMFTSLIETVNAKAAKEMEKLGVVTAAMVITPPIKAQPIADVKVGDLKKIAKAFNQVAKEAIIEILKSTAKTVDFAELASAVSDKVATMESVGGIKLGVTKDQVAVKATTTTPKPTVPSNPPTNSTNQAPTNTTTNSNVPATQPKPETNTTGRVQRKVRRGLAAVGVSEYYARMVDGLVI